MPDTAISALSALTALANQDEFVIVDKSDTTQGAGGTTKRIPLSTFLADPATLAALTPAPTAWTTLPLLNGWVSYGAGYVPQYRKIGDNVQIRGLMQNGPATGTAFQLPVGFRPAYEETFAALWNANKVSALSISIGGTASLQAGFTTGYCYLTGIFFSTVL